MFIRGRGAEERALLFTTRGNILRVDFDGKGDIPPGAGPPGEFPIHGELFKARPEVQCVVHAHPWGALYCGLAGLPLRPVIGAFDPAALAFALEPVPVFERSITLLNATAVAPMLEVMGNAPAVLMRGHGITVVGSSVQEATINAVKLEKMARITWQTSQHGGVRIADISADDQAYFREALQGYRSESVRAAYRRGWEGIWRYYVKLLEQPPARSPSDTPFGSVP
jgi:ribulose-5-phosphate 4-epimerase/fuculose-1-phosphate aldolase